MPDPGELSGRFLVGVKLTPAQIDLLNDRLLVFSIGVEVADSSVTPDVFIDAVANPPIPPDPPVATTKFGVNTLCGFGGVPSGQAAGSLITGTGAADWAIDSAGNLVPSGTYGAAKTFSKSAGQTYSLTYADASTVSVLLEAAKSHITATISDTSTANQLRAALLANHGGTIVGRDCYINPHGALWRVKVPILGWTAVTVKSENPATGTDANGNPNRGGGLKIGCFAFDCSSFPELSGPVPVTFDSVTFTVEEDIPHSNFLGYTSPAGYGVSQTKCRFANTSAVSLNNFQNGFDNRGGSSTFGHFFRVFRGHTGGMVSGVAQTIITDNVFEQMASDANTLSGTNFSILRNFGFNYLFKSGAHPDSCQHLGTQTQNYTGFGEVAYNIWVRNAGVDGISDAQGDFFDDTIAPWTISGAHIHHEIMILTSRNAVVTTRFLAPQVNNCLCIFALNSNSGSTLTPTISTAGAVSGATVTDCVANGYSFGTGTDTRNTTLAKALGTYQLAMPYYRDGPNPGYTNRQTVLDAVTPANLLVASGGFKNPDLTYRGPLKHDGTYTDV